MSLYQYKCDKCGHIFEAFCCPSTRDNALCPECDSLANRQYTPVAFTFGWRLSDESLNDVNSYKPDTMERNI